LVNRNSGAYIRYIIFKVGCHIVWYYNCFYYSICVSSIKQQAIAAAIRRNAGTGDNINAVIIDNDGYRELSKEMKEAVGAIY
jgi:hypothetical protein